MTGKNDSFLFRVSNHHPLENGEPPIINGDKGSCYFGYFSNRYGEQFVFEYDYQTKLAALWCGDTGWKSYPVGEDGVKGLLLNKEEQIWVLACLNAVGINLASKWGKNMATGGFS